MKKCDRRNFNISHPAISKHIKCSIRPGISRDDKSRERVCALNQRGFKDVQDWIEYFEGYWNQQMKTLDQLPEEISRRQKKKKV